MLTEECVDELFRFFSSYQHDHSVENVFLESSSGIFSFGVDFRTLLSSPDYLDKIYKLTALVARMNKPILAQVAGGVRGVAAYILSMIPMPLGYHNANLKIDEPSRGFIPIAGGSHRLSRLPL